MGASKAGKRRERQRLEEAVNVRVPERARPPGSCVAELGPTNSGKTFDGLQLLVAEGRGVFAAPLRMLAHETYVTLSDLVGAESVGLRTGEERINEHAPILCCTAELAPMSGHVLVLDEVHWAADPARGFAWTRLLAGGTYEHLRLLGAPDALGLLRACFADTLDVRAHRRLAPLHWAGGVDIADLERGDIVVAFSRKSVLYLAGQIAGRYGADRVACLYGAMPPAARRAEIERVRSGAADFCVATDVLGHGLNLPAQRVLFAETEKWDGDDRRPLRPWEAGQIAGRAGRYGIIDQDGQAGVLTGVSWLSPQPPVARAGLTPRLDVGEGLRAFEEVTHGRLRPELEDLAVSRADQVAAALSAWQHRAERELSGHPWVLAEDVGPLLDRVGLAAGAVRSALTDMPAAWLWHLACAPLDVADDRDRDLLTSMARSLAGRGDLRYAVCHDTDGLGLAAAERVARDAAALRWFAHLHPEAGGVDVDEAAEMEDAAARRVIECLRAELQRPSTGRCSTCDRPCAPWRRTCAHC